MTKYLLLLTLMFSGTILAAEMNDFEAELRMLETQEETTFSRAESITNTVLNNQKRHESENELMTDSVSTSNAGILKNQENSAPSQENIDKNQVESSEIYIPARPPLKARRVRSR